jgi:hypothetical protein
VSAGAVAVALLLAASAVVHLVALASLAARAPARAAVALVVPPLASYGCWQLGMKRRAAAWWVVVVVYAIARVLAAA